MILELPVYPSLYFLSLMVILLQASSSQVTQYADIKDMDIDRQSLYVYL